MSISPILYLENTFNSAIQRFLICILRLHFISNDNELPSAKHGTDGSTDCDRETTSHECDGLEGRD